MSFGRRLSLRAIISFFYRIINRAISSSTLSSKLLWRAIYFSTKSNTIRSNEAGEYPYIKTMSFGRRLSLRAIFSFFYREINRAISSSTLSSKLQWRAIYFSKKSNTIRSNEACEYPYIKTMSFGGRYSLRAIFSFFNRILNRAISLSTLSSNLLRWAIYFSKTSNRIRPNKADRYPYRTQSFSQCFTLRTRLNVMHCFTKSITIRSNIANEFTNFTFQIV